MQQHTSTITPTTMGSEVSESSPPPSPPLAAAGVVFARVCGSDVGTGAVVELTATTGLLGVLLRDRSGLGEMFGGPLAVRCGTGSEGS